MNDEPQKEVERNCPECDGTGEQGEHEGMQPVRLGEKLDFRPCTTCGGSGKIKEAAN
jgi:DnaJ-class molecular chaperone